MDGRSNIRLRACMAVIERGKVLLVPHYYGDTHPMEWFLPGGGVQFGEYLQDAVVREFFEETGFEAACDDFLGIAEAIEPEVPWHGVTIAFRGHIVGGKMRAEDSIYGQYGDKTPRWFSAAELSGLLYKPRELIEKVLVL